VIAELKPLAVGFSEAARLAGLSEKTLRRAARDGRLTVVKVGRAQRVRIADLEQFLGDAPEGRLASYERAQARLAAEAAGRLPGREIRPGPGSPGAR
jgi:excisionase family DNA binding protein